MTMKTICDPQVGLFETLYSKILKDLIEPAHQTTIFVRFNDFEGHSWLSILLSNFNFIAFQSTPVLEESLKDSGKSRADLWAFAAIVAVEFGIENTNLACDDEYVDNPLNPHNSRCNQEFNTTQCHVSYFLLF